MSYSSANEASPKSYYKAVLDGFYTETVFNPVKNEMISTSYLPIQSNLMPAAISASTGMTESLTCADQNPDYRCVTNMDCPGSNSNCGRCLNHQCRK